MARAGVKIDDPCYTFCDSNLCTVVPLGPTVVESLLCLWEIKKRDPLEAIRTPSSPIFLKGARRRNLSANSLAAYERTWTRFLAWTAAASFDPRR